MTGVQTCALPICPPFLCYVFIRLLLYLCHDIYIPACLRCLPHIATATVSTYLWCFGKRGKTMAKSRTSDSCSADKWSSLQVCCPFSAPVFLLPRAAFEEGFCTHVYIGRSRKWPQILNIPLLVFPLPPNLGAPQFPDLCNISVL